MIFRIALFLTLCLVLKGAADQPSIVERLQKIDEQREYYPKKVKHYHGIVGAELLYWKADLDGVAYATTSEFISSGVSTHVKTHTPHFAYDPGFRVYIGIQSPFDLFDAVLMWTRFSTQGHDRAHGTLAGDKIIFSDIGLIQGLISIPNEAKAKVELTGNLLDLQLGRGIMMSNHFFFRPYFGLRAVWSNVDWNIAFTRNYFFPDAAAQDSTRLKVDNHFRGIGGLFGMIVDWKLPKGFGIYNRVSGALVYGRSIEATHQEYFFVPAFSQTETERDYRAHNSFYCVKALWGMFGGMYWESKMLKPRKYRMKTGHVRLRITAGYEFQQWPAIAQKTNVQASRERERYTVDFQGFTGGIWVVF